MDDPRIGRITPERIDFPATTISGDAYERPATMTHIGQGYFVVLDAFGTPDEALLAELRAKVAPPVETSSGKKGKVDASEPTT